MTEDVKKQSTDYISFKDQQAEQRRIAKEQEELANRPWYEKTWDFVCNFTGKSPDIMIIRELLMVSIQS